MNETIDLTNFEESLELLAEMLEMPISGVRGRVRLSTGETEMK